MTTTNELRHAPTSRLLEVLNLIERAARETVRALVVNLGDVDSGRPEGVVRGCYTARGAHAHPLDADACLRLSGTVETFIPMGIIRGVTLDDDRVIIAVSKSPWLEEVH